MAALSVRCSRSTRPLATGWIPHSLATQWKTSESNWLPWSVVMVCGQPKRYIQPESRACDTVSAVMGWGKAADQHVKRSTAVRQYWNPADDGRGPTRSTWICRKREGGRGNLQNVVTVWREALRHWQSSWMAGHTKLWETSLAVANSGVAEGMLSFEYPTEERRWDV